MEYKQLKTFVTVAKLGNLTKAADVLHITQPAVSGQLKSLEEELDLKLFSRTTSSVALTQSGYELLPKAEKALEVFGEFVNAAKTLRGKIEGRLKIGIVMLSPELLRIGEFIQDMVVTHKALSIALEVGRISWLIDAVISGDIDGALYTGRALPKDTRGVELERLTFRVVAPAAWKNRLQNTTWSDAALMPWIRTTQPSAHHEMVSDILRQTSIKPVEIVEADHEFIIRALVTAGVGIGLMREDLAIAAQNAGEVIILGEEKAFTMLSFIYHENRQHDPAIQAAVAVLRKIWGLNA